MSTEQPVNREVTEAEATDRGLTQGGCCCPDHPHSWYERTTPLEVWIECNHCGDAL